MSLSSLNDSFDKNRTSDLFSPWTHERFDRFNHESVIEKEQKDRRVINQLKSLSRNPIPTGQKDELINDCPTIKKKFNIEHLATNTVFSGIKSEIDPNLQIYHHKTEYSPKLKKKLFLYNDTPLSRTRILKHLKLSASTEITETQKATLDRKTTKIYSFSKNRKSGTLPHTVNPLIQTQDASNYFIPMNKPRHQPPAQFSNMLEGPLYIGNRLETPAPEACHKNTKTPNYLFSSKSKHSATMLNTRKQTIGHGFVIGDGLHQLGGVKSSRAGRGHRLRETSIHSDGVISGNNNRVRIPAGSKVMTFTDMRNTTTVTSISKLIPSEYDCPIEKPAAFSVEIFNLCRKLEAEQEAAKQKALKEKLHKQQTEKNKAEEMRKVDLKKKNDIMSVFKKINTLSQCDAGKFTSYRALRAGVSPNLLNKHIPKNTPNLSRSHKTEAD